MIDEIHWVLGSPPRFEASTLARCTRRLFPILYHVELAIFVATSMARLLLIALVVVPSLACTFIALGIFLHIPRMGAYFVLWVYGRCFTAHGCPKLYQ